MPDEFSSLDNLSDAQYFTPMFGIFRIFRKAIFYALILLAIYLWVQNSRNNEPPQNTVHSPQYRDRDGFARPVSRPADLVPATRAEAIIIDKSERIMQLLAGGKVVASYDIALGFAPAGQKMREGDGKTPIGNYEIDWRNENSQFYKSLHISYPRPDQLVAARVEARDPGGMIMIHGQPNGSRYIGFDAIRQDWTNGCIAVSNAEMDRIWSLVNDGTPITIVE